MIYYPLYVFMHHYNNEKRLQLSMSFVYTGDDEKDEITIILMRSTTIMERDFNYPCQLYAQELMRKMR